MRIRSFLLTSALYLALGDPALAVERVGREAGPAGAAVATLPAGERPAAGREAGPVPGVAPGRDRSR